MINIRDFLTDLELPQSIRDSIGKERTNKELQVYCQTLPQLKYPDTYKLAGKLLIYLNIKTSPSCVRDYVKVLSEILNNDIKKFFLKHEKIINTTLSETYMKNFDFNILSASSCINYLLRLSPEEAAVETPCQMAMRQAVQFYYTDGIDSVLKCYHEIVDKKYVHASPTMFNAGTKKNQMSSCFLFTLGDNLESLLYTGVGDIGMVSKKQGGIGLSLNGVRHSAISNTGNSSGVLPFGKIYDAMISCVDQGGKRNGAITMTLNDWHIDFPDFIQTRDNYTHNGIRYKQANICAYLSSLFMERVLTNKKWTLFCPARASMDIDGKKVKLLGKHSHEFDYWYPLFENEARRREIEFKELENEISNMEKQLNIGDYNDEFLMNYHGKISERRKLRKNLMVYKEVSAFDLYEKICDMHVKSSMPYIVYRDTCNYKNNMRNIGPCEGPNLCLEIIEPSTPGSVASCNLAHLNLKYYVTNEFREGMSLKDCYNFKELGKSTRSIVQNLNRVVLNNKYPLDKFDKNGNLIERGKISEPNLDNKPLGIGVSGLAEVFANMDIYYDSEQAFELNKMIFACIYYNALLESCNMASDIETGTKGRQVGFHKDFNTGKFSAYIDGEWKDLNGSPLSNGFFQFDLWKQEADYLRSIERLNEELYVSSDDKPIEPSEWRQNGSWENLRTNIKNYGVVNSMLIALMPTASSAQMLNNAETTEAHQTLVYSRKLAHGNYTAFSEPFVKDMVKYNLWNDKAIDFIMMCNGSIKDFDRFMIDNKDIFPRGYYNGDKFTPQFEDLITHLKRKHRGMYEISQKVCMKMARQRGIYICQSQSLNIYLPEPSLEQLKAVHMYSNALRLKTGMYYLRANPASQTSRFTVDVDVQKYHRKIVCKEDVCVMCQ